MPLRRLGRPDLAIVLKIETRRGFENLPQMLLSAYGPQQSRHQADAHDF